jgi:hypothetical protein
VGCAAARALIKGACLIVESFLNPSVQLAVQRHVVHIESIQDSVLQATAEVEGDAVEGMHSHIVSIDGNARP